MASSSSQPNRAGANDLMTRTLHSLSIAQPQSEAQFYGKPQSQLHPLYPAYSTSRSPSPAPIAIDPAMLTRSVSRAVTPCRSFSPAPAYNPSPSRLACYSESPSVTSREASPAVFADTSAKKRTCGVKKKGKAKSSAVDNPYPKDKQWRSGFVNPLGPDGKKLRGRPPRKAYHDAGMPDSYSVPRAAVTETARQVRRYQPPTESERAEKRRIQANERRRKAQEEKHRVAANGGETRWVRRSERMTKRVLSRDLSETPSLEFDDWGEGPSQDADADMDDGYSLHGDFEDDIAVLARETSVCLAEPSVPTFTPSPAQMLVPSTNWETDASYSHPTVEGIHPNLPPPFLPSEPNVNLSLSSGSPWIHSLDAPSISLDPLPEYLFDDGFCAAAVYGGSGDSEMWSSGGEMGLGMGIGGDMGKSCGWEFEDTMTMVWEEPEDDSFEDLYESIGLGSSAGVV